VLSTLVATAQAGLIGKTVTHQCPECGPPLSVNFVPFVGGPEITPFGQDEIDVEDFSIKATWLIDSTSIINPGHWIFSWNPADYTITSAAVDASSTLHYGLSFTPSSVTLDISGIPVRVGDFVLVNLTPVPEPSTWSLIGLGLAGAAFFRRRGKFTFH
jgi:hypothetical protein